MQVSAEQLVVEYGGKLRACERRVTKALEVLTEKSAQHLGMAKEAVSTVQHLRGRFNLLLAAHGEEVGGVVSGTNAGVEQAKEITLSPDQVWVVESIDDLYGRLALR